MFLGMCLLAFSFSASADMPAEIHPMDFPRVRTLPDPFLFCDGRRVRSEEDWRKRRRELLDLMLDIEYGHPPEGPYDTPEAVSLGKTLILDGKFTHEGFKVSFGPDKNLSTNLHLYRPVDTAAYPCGLVLRVGVVDKPPVSILEGGYAFAAFDILALDPDEKEFDAKGPAQLLYPDQDWGSIAVWAWGASRMLDYLLTLPEINAKQLVVTGHSRCGKAALLAGALDERFALVVPNGSGCGGAGTYRVMGKKAETLQMITQKDRFYSWFRPGFGQFADRKKYHLPFDQHSLQALIAPRALLLTEALEDHWANPIGVQAGYLGAKEVYSFLGVNERIALHFRPGKHDQLPQDFLLIRQMADYLFKGKPRPTSLDHLPFPKYKPAYRWHAPKPKE